MLKIYLVYEEKQSTNIIADSLSSITYSFKQAESPPPSKIYHATGNSFAKMDGKVLLPSSTYCCYFSVSGNSETDAEHVAKSTLGKLEMC
jgi:hypothetical protein